MPLDDAMGLLVKHFEQSVEMKAKSGAGPGENHPGDIVAVLDFLRENRPLSVMEYDKLIKYLCARRTQMLKTEYGDAVPANLARPPIGPPVDPAVKTKQEELQNKIGAILDGQKELFPSVRPDPEPQPPPAINPTLQKAIDSLLSTGGKGIGGVGGGDPPPPPPPLPPPQQNPMRDDYSQQNPGSAGGFGRGGQNHQGWGGGGGGSGFRGPQQPPLPQQSSHLQMHQQKMFAKYGGF